MVKFLSKNLGILGLLVAAVLFFSSATPVLALTTADVTVNATGAFLSISVAPTTYDFGYVAASSATNTTTNYFTATNGSSVATNTTIKVTGDWTGSGTPWTAADDGAGGNNIAGVWAYSPDSSTWGVIVKKTVGAGFNELVHNKAASTNWGFGLALNAPTVFTDGQHNQNTVRLTISQ